MLEFDKPPLSLMSHRLPAFFPYVDETSPCRVSPREEGVVFPSPRLHFFPQTPLTREEVD